MRDSEKSGKKSIKAVEKLRTHKAKLERVSRDTKKPKKPEKPLQAAEDLYRAVMDNTFFNTFFGFSLIDRNYRIIMVNSTLSRYFQKPANKLIGRKCFREFEKRQSICPHCPGTRAMATGRPAEVETEGVLDNGSHFSARIQAFPTLDPDGAITGFIEIVEDITERKKIEDRLSAAIYKSAIPTAVGGPDGSIIAFNEAMETLIGYKMSEVSDVTDWANKLYPDKKYREFVWKNIKQALEGRKQDCTEFTITCKDGSTKVIDFHTSFFKGGLVIQMQDITERKKMEQQLKDAFNLNQIIIDTSPVGIWIFEESGQFVMFNPSGAALSGGTAEQLLKLNFRELESWKKSGLLQAAEEALLTGKLVKKEIHTVNTFNTEVWYEALLSTIQFKGKKHLLLTTYDIKDRKHSEESLRISERDLAEAQKIAHVGSWRWEIIPDEVYWSDEVYRLFGVEPGEPVDYVRYLSIVLPEDRDFVMKEVQDALDGTKPYENKHRIVRNGEIRIHHTKGTVTWDEQGRPIRLFGVVQDITEHKKAEESLRESEAFLSATGQMAKVGGWEIDVITKEVRWTEETYHIHEVPLDYKPSLDEAINFFHPEDRPKLASAIQRALEHGEPYDMEIRFITSKGRHLLTHTICMPHMKDGKTVKLTGTFQDITEHKRVEEALRETTQMLKAVIQASPLPICTLDRERIVKTWNPAAERTFGWSAQEVIGRKYPAIPEEKMDEADALFSRALESGLTEAEAIRQRKDGSLIDVSISAAPLYDSRGNINGTMAVITDITERKKAEQKLRKDQQQLRSLASQLTLAEERERSRIAAELHDETAQSVGISKMKLEELCKSVHDEGLEKKLGEICVSLDQAIKNIRSLIFKVSSPILGQFGLVEAVQDWLIEEIEKKHGIQIEFQDDGQKKQLDDDASALLFRNVRELLTNVVKYAHATKVKVSIQKFGDKIKVCVKDNGTGFDIDKVVDKVVNKGGFGLFSICQRLEYLGGQLEIKSEPGHGCTVTMTAPLKQDEAQR